jgi:hypothetical protein
MPKIAWFWFGKMGRTSRRAVLQIYLGNSPLNSGPSPRSKFTVKHKSPSLSLRNMVFIIYCIAAAWLELMHKRSEAPRPEGWGFPVKKIFISN